MARKDLKKSKYAFVDEKKLDDMYFTKFLRELWSVPYDKITEYVHEFYPSPTATELVEIRQLESIIKKCVRNKDGEVEGLNDDDLNSLYYRHNRMWGKERQVIELSGREGGAITIQDMSDEQLEKELKGKLTSIVSAIKKAEKEDE